MMMMMMMMMMIHMREPGPCPTKGFCYNLPEPEAGTDDGVRVDERMPQ